MSSSEDDRGDDRGGITLHRLKPSLPGERWFWILFLAVFGTSPIWATGLGLYFGYISLNIGVESSIVFRPDLSFLGVWLGRLFLVALGGVFLYAFARVTGVAFLAGLLNTLDAMIDGYDSPHVRVESDEGGDEEE